ncbi:hypothetical protein D3C79_1016090 [compost metagenome]
MLAGIDEQVLPVRDALAGESREVGRDEAQGQVVDRNRHSAVEQEIHGLAQRLLIVQRVNPQFFVVLPGQAGTFDTHQRNMLHEGQVPEHVVGELGQAWRGQAIEHHA